MPELCLPDPVAAPVRPPRLHRPGTAITDASSVPAHRPTVVLLHSSASSSRQWDRLAAALQSRAVVHAIDLHGHGAQRDWHGRWRLSLADEVALFAPLLEHPGGVHLVAHSYGAAVALKAAALHPAAVRSLVVYEPVMFGWLIDDRADRQRADARPIDAVIAVADAVRTALAQRKAHEAGQRFIDFWSGTGAWASLSPERQAAIAARMPAVHRHFVALFADTMTASELTRVRAPMLFMTGERTVPVMRHLAEHLSLRVPHALHELQPAMDHMGPVVHAGSVNRRIVEFLRSLEPALTQPVPAPARAAA
jgi:pimeloyl-ACP methyl ester carboxylesterase